VDTIGNNSGFDRFIVAYSRPQNIRDVLIKSNLMDKGVCASSFLQLESYMPWYYYEIYSITEQLRQKNWPRVTRATSPCFYAVSVLS
jgi:hypothetical protein